MKKLMLFTAAVMILTAMYAQNTATGKDRARGIVLPQSDYHYKRVQYYIENEPDADYVHASEKAYEAFRDMKFAVRIHWGIYSMWRMNGESWGFLDLPREKKMEYNELYKTFNPKHFDADEWMDFFKRSGMRAFAFTTKHHEGFSLYHTETKVIRRVNYLDSVHLIEPCNLHYSVEETPFGRDIVGELCKAAHRRKIKINLYFSHPDWYDADFRPYNNHPLTTDRYRTFNGDYGWEPGECKYEFITPEPTAEETARAVSRHREQLRELLTNYGKIDMLCFDQWMGKDIWPEMKETVKMLRKLQPDVMMRARGIGNYGDYYTPERFVPESLENTNMPWMTIYPLASSFSYDVDSTKYKGTQWVVHNIIECAAKGGSFMVGIGPDGDGRFHPAAVGQLEEAGRWLAVNGKGIYNTRERKIWKEDSTYFTRTKDSKLVFAFVEQFPENELVIRSVTPKAGSKVYMLGYKRQLKWSAIEGGGVRIEIPDGLKKAENRPCRYAWGFEMRE
jgi:alpha-L-fucosidase